MAIKLSTLSIWLGRWSPARVCTDCSCRPGLKDIARKFPRSLPVGYLFMLWAHGLVHVECEPRIAGRF